MHLLKRIGTGLAGLLMLGGAVAVSTAPAQADAGFVPISKPVVLPAEMPTPPKPLPADKPGVGFKASKGMPGLDLKAGPSKVSAAALTGGTESRTYAVARKALSVPAADNGCSFYATIHSPFVSTADAHSITECSVHYRGNIVEVGYRKASDGTLILFTYAWKRDPVTGNPVQLCYNGCGMVNYSGETAIEPGMSLTSYVGAGEKNFYIQHFNGVWWVGFDGKYFAYWPDSVFGTQTPAFDRGDVVQVFSELAGRAYSGSGSGSTDICSDMGSNKLPSQTGAQELRILHIVGGLTADDTWTIYTTANSGVTVNPLHYNIAAFNNTGDASRPRNFKDGGPGSC